MYQILDYSAKLLERLLFQNFSENHDGACSIR